MKSEPLTREFRYESLKLPDPNRAMTIEQVQNFYATSYVEIATASVVGPEVVGNKLVFRFQRSVGTKG